MDSSQLIALIERIERLNEEATTIAADLKSVMNEVKCAGFEPKYVKQMIKLRKMDRDELDETDELTKMYRKALGI